MADTAKPEGGSAAPKSTPSNHAYLAARATSRGARMVGLAKVGMVSSILSTAGLSLLCKRGRAVTGAALLAAAAGLALWKREGAADG